MDFFDHPADQLRGGEPVAEELDAIRERWGAVVDPYYNPNLNPETFDYRFGD